MCGLKSLTKYRVLFQAHLDQIMWVSYALVAAALMVVGGIGGWATDTGPWYRDLKKPSWNPPDWVFPLVWTTIYLLIIYAVGSVWNAAPTEKRLTILLLVGINFTLNLLWSIIFFTLKNPMLALYEVALLWLSIAALIVYFAGISVISALILLPYLIWVSVAALLNYKIVTLNNDAAVVG
jgi:tryptophan-rich sensory protein